MKKYPPAPACITCGKPASETGGRRFMGTPRYGFFRLSINEKIGNRTVFPARLVRLKENLRDVVVWLWGSRWTDEHAERVAQSFQRGESPWFCQRCSGSYLCTRCGSPLALTPGATELHDDGTDGYHPSFTQMGQHCPTCFAPR